MPWELGPEDIIDEVVLRAYREFVREPERRKSATWLERLAREQLETERRRLEGERERSIHIEEDIPETSPTEETSTLGEEILYYHQPDEDLKVEDVMPATTPQDLPEEFRRSRRSPNQTR